MFVYMLPAQVVTVYGEVSLKRLGIVVTTDVMEEG